VATVTTARSACGRRRGLSAPPSRKDRSPKKLGSSGNGSPPSVSFLRLGFPCVSWQGIGGRRWVVAVEFATLPWVSETDGRGIKGRGHQGKQAV